MPAGPAPIIAGPFVLAFFFLLSHSALNVRSVKKSNVMWIVIDYDRGRHLNVVPGDVDGLMLLYL